MKLLITSFILFFLSDLSIATNLAPIENSQQFSGPLEEAMLSHGLGSCFTNAAEFSTQDKTEFARCFCKNKSSPLAKKEASNFDLKPFGETLTSSNIFIGTEKFGNSDPLDISLPSEFECFNESFHIKKLEGSKDLYLIYKFDDETFKNFPILAFTKEILVEGTVFTLTPSPQEEALPEVKKPMKRHHKKKHLKKIKKPKKKTRKALPKVKAEAPKIKKPKKAVRKTKPEVMPDPMVLIDWRNSSRVLGVAFQYGNDMNAQEASAPFFVGFLIGRLADPSIEKNFNNLISGFEFEFALNTEAAFMKKEDYKTSSTGEVVKKWDFLLSTKVFANTQILGNYEPYLSFGVARYTDYTRKTDAFGSGWDFVPGFGLSVENSLGYFRFGYNGVINTFDLGFSFAM